MAPFICSVPFFTALTIEGGMKLFLFPPEEEDEEEAEEEIGEELEIGPEPRGALEAAA